MPSDPPIIVRIRCRNLPGTRFENRAAVRLGIQKGQEVVDDVAGDADGATFLVPLRVSGNTATGSPNLLGPFAQGTPTSRFIYLCWGERVGEEWDPFRRAKVPLQGLTWESVQNSQASGEPIEISVEMTDERGGPACGSVAVSC